MSKLRFMLALSVLKASFACADIVPVINEVSVTDAKNQCAAVGSPVGLSMSTVTAQNNQFYIAACERPDGNGGSTYVPAWSASSVEDAQKRCTAKSATTGLDAGIAVGQSLSVTANSDRIYVIVCNEN